jgi:hypothetical protein
LVKTGQKISGSTRSRLEEVCVSKCFATLFSARRGGANSILARALYVVRLTFWSENLRFAPQ